MEINEEEAQVIIEGLLRAAFRDVETIWGEKELKCALDIIKKMRSIIPNKSIYRIVIKKPGATMPALRSLLQI